jgi:hypothetical protein
VSLNAVYRELELKKLRAVRVGGQRGWGVSVKDLEHYTGQRYDPAAAVA